MRDHYLKAYYFSTPVLWLIDILWGVNVRAAGFDSLPLLKHFYFGLCILCAIAIWRLPQWSWLISLSESSVNVLSLIVGMLGPYYKFIGSVSEEVPVMSNPLTPHVIMNFVFAGTAACISFYRLQGNLAMSRDQIR